MTMRMLAKALQLNVAPIPPNSPTTQLSQHCWHRHSPWVSVGQIGIIDLIR